MLSTDDSQGARREERWKDLALATLGGNELRASAAARAAAAAEAAGRSADKSFDAARDAYQAAEAPATPMDGARPALVVRPSGGKRFLLVLIGAVVLGVGASIVRFGSQGLLPTIGASVCGAVLIYALWMRCSVVVEGRTISVQGPLRRRRLDQLAISEIVVGLRLIRRGSTSGDLSHFLAPPCRLGAVPRAFLFRTSPRDVRATVLRSSFPTQN